MVPLLPLKIGGRITINRLFTSAIIQSVSKGALAKLRKKTGYTFANCRKALELHENDVTKAEEWLKEQAKALGWAKATKLEGRPTAQGLVGVGVAKDRAVMVEVNCETDFVARNSKFKTLVEMVTATCLKHQFKTQLLLSEDLKVITAEDGLSLADHLALVIGSIGENVSLRRAFAFTVEDGIKISGLTHPTPTVETPVLLGKYGALVAYTAPDGVREADLGRQLCQHVIGMSPRSVGVIGQDEAATSKEEETCMVHQEYLLDPDMTVGQLLTDAQASVVAFQRFECGEHDEAVQPVQDERTESVRAEG